MYKAVLVDDEILITEGLKAIIDWDELEIDVVHTAQDGLSAWEYIRTHPVDILLSDINMPKMDGLTLIEQVSATFPTIKNVILSGYNEFEYAKKAMALSVKNYLLKPLDTDELYETLENVVSELDGNKEHFVATIDEKAELLNAIYSRWIYGTISSKSLDERLEVLGVDLDYTTYQFVFIQLDQNIEELLSKMQRMQQDMDIITTAIIQQRYIAVLIGIDKARDVLQTTEILVSNCREEFPTARFIISESVSRRENVSKLFDESLPLLLYFFLQPQFSIVNSEYLLSLEEYPLPRVADDYFSKYIIVRDDTSIIYIIKNMLDHLIQEQKYSNNQFVTYVFTIYASFVKKLEALNFINPEFVDRYLFSFSVGIADKYTYENIYAFIEDTIIADMSELPPISNLHPSIREAKEFIDQHFTEDISIQKLATDIRMNAAYLGQLFQSEMGVSLTEYLNNVRLMQAHYEICHTRMTMSEIAFSVGFRDVSYFYKKFKNKYGIAPRKLRS